MSLSNYISNYYDKLAYLREAEDEETPTDYTTSDTDNTNTDNSGQSDSETDNTTTDEPTDYTGDNANDNNTDESDDNSSDDTNNDSTNDNDTSSDDNDNETTEQPTDYTDGAEDDSNSTDDDSSISSDTEIGDSQGTSVRNTLIKNYNLLGDFDKVAGLIDDTVSSIESTIYSDIVHNKIAAQVSKNLTKIKDFISTFVKFYFNEKNYEFNLYYYEVVMKSLEMNLLLLGKIKDTPNEQQNIKKT